MLTFDDLQREATYRAKYGFKVYDEKDVSYFAMAMMGEGGELCNLLAKIERAKVGALGGSNTKQAEEITTGDLAEELAGMIIYASQVASKLNIDLGKAVQETFNLKSLKMGFKHRI